MWLCLSCRFRPNWDGILQLPILKVMTCRAGSVDQAKNVARKCRVDASFLRDPHQAVLKRTSHLH